MAVTLLVSAGVIAYANSFHGPFIFDDYPSIETNATIRHLWPLTAVVLPSRETPTPLAGRPLANLTFAINYAVGGLNVAGYHVVNLAIHLLAGVTLLGVLRRTLGSTKFVPPGKDSRPPFYNSVLCSLVWVVHPLNTEVVDYLTQRTEALAALFCLMTLYAAIRAWDTERPRPWQALAVAACACGIASKESALTAPLIVALYDRVFVCGSLREALARRGRLYLALAACWLLFAALVWHAPFFHAEAFYSPGGGFGARVSPWTYLLNQAPMIGRYLGLALLPRGLVLDYGAPGPVSLANVWPWGALLLILVTLTFIALGRLPQVGFWGAWFFLTLAPASSIVPIPTEVGAERRMYLPLVAVIVLVVLAAQALLRRLAGSSEQAGRPLQIAAVTCAVLTLIGFTVGTWRRNAEYQSAVSIWQTVVDRRPNPRAHANFAAVLGEAGRTEEALAHLRLAAPEFVDARRLLGLELLVRGEYRDAITYLSDFARAAPDDPDILQVRKALAAAYVRIGDLRGARTELEAVTTRAPEDASAHLDLGDLLLSQGDFAGAVGHYRECQRLEPLNVAVLVRIEKALAPLGGRGEPIELFLAEVRSSLARAAGTRR